MFAYRLEGGITVKLLQQILRTQFSMQPISSIALLCDKLKLNKI